MKKKELQELNARLEPYFKSGILNIRMNDGIMDCVMENMAVTFLRVEVGTLADIKDFTEEKEKPLEFWFQWGEETNEEGEIIPSLSALYVPISYKIETEETYFSVLDGDTCLFSFVPSIELSVDDSILFANTLLDPPEPNKFIQELVAKFREKKRIFSDVQF